jgi:small GTP-binding protein
MARSGRRALVVGEKGIARIFEFPTVLDIAQAALDGGSRYTNAKVLLVGETGVGKSGLAIRLSQKRFEPTASTDGHWATQLPLPNESGTGGRQREIWLWDFAGQADYRLMHQLFMDETALAVLVFNPQSENPFEGLGEWDRDLQRAARRPFKKLLVAGRCDRGGLMISRRIVERFRQERGFSDYIETSALQGTGCEKLCEAIIRQIPWNDIPWTASPRIFRLLKDEVIKLKDEGRVLLRMSELKQQLELRLPGESFSLEELRAVVGLLAGPGIVWQLEFGDFVLVQPERANAYAAAVIRSVRAHTEEIGCIAEEDVLVGKLDFQDMKRLPPEEEQIVLRAMHQTFVDHGLCLREHTEKGTLLIFPSYFKRERPELKAHPLVLVTYQFNGPLDEIYATLVVRLHYTAPFEKDRLWRFAADFKTESGKRLGLKMTKKGEGTGELELYFESGIANDVQVMFIRYVHEHLKLKAQDVCRLRHYVCPHCHEPVENRRAIDKRLSEGKKDILCGACERRVELVDLIEEKFASEEFLRRVCELEEQAKVAIDNESRELILVGHTYAIAGEAGQIYRQYTNSDHGIDGEIEFKDYEGKASGKRLYLQLKSGDSYLYQRKEDGVEVFTIKNERLADYWQKQAYPVMLVIRISDGTIRWMDISEYLKRESRGGEQVKQVVFKGEPLTALSVRQMRDRFVPLPKSG